MLQDHIKDIEKLFDEITKVVLSESLKEALHKIFFGSNNQYIYQYFRSRLMLYSNNFQQITEKALKLNDNNTTNSKYLKPLIEEGQKQIESEIKKVMDELTARLSSINEYEKIIKYNNISNSGYGIRSFVWIGKNFEKQIISLHTLLEDAKFIESGRFIDFYNIFTGRFFLEFQAIRWLVEAPNKKNSSVCSLLYFISLLEEEQLIRKNIILPNPKTDLSAIRYFFADRYGKKFKSLKQANYQYKFKSSTPSKGKELEKIVQIVKSIV
jgi:hypothetical protein